MAAAAAATDRGKRARQESTQDGTSSAPHKRNALDDALLAFFSEAAAENALIDTLRPYPWYRANCAAPRSRNSSLHRFECSRSSFCQLASSFLGDLSRKHKSRKAKIGEEDIAFVSELIADRRGCGRLSTLPSEAEKRVFERLRLVQQETGFLSSKLVQVELLCECAQPQDDSEQQDANALRAGILSRASQLGKHAVAGFCARFGFKTTSARPLSEERKMQYQPEVAADWGRLFIHTQMVVMIANAIGRGEVVEGWGCEDGMLPHRTDEGPDFREGDLTIDSDGDIFVPVLNTKLLPIGDDVLFALDEVPMPTRLASPTSLTSSYEALRELAQLPNVHVTITPMTSRGKGLLAVQVLTPMKLDHSKLPDHRTDDDRKVHVHLGRQQKGFQTNETMRDFVLWLAGINLGTSPTNWGILIVDGYGAHLTREVKNALAKLHIIGLVEPSQSSTWAQSGDQGGNHAGHANFRSLNTSELCRLQINKGRMTHIEQVDIMVDAFCKVPSRIWKDGFSKVGLPSGLIIGFRERFKSSLWAPGSAYRRNLPDVSQRLCNTLFSIPNLVRFWGSAMIVEKTVVSEAAKQQVNAALALRCVPQGNSAVLYWLKIGGKEEAHRLYEGKWEGQDEGDEGEDGEEASGDDAEDGEEDAPAVRRGINTRRGLAFWTATTAADMERIAAAKEKKAVLAEEKKKALDKQALLRLKLVQIGFLSTPDRDKARALTVGLLDRVFEANRQSLAFDSAQWARSKKDEKIELLQTAIEQQRVQLVKK